MSDWRPTASVTTARRRAEMLQRARDYFSVADVLAIDTPALSAFANTDPNIESLVVRSAFGGDSFLHTSPEFSMKRMLAAGYPDIYSICRVFRDGEDGKRHCREFTIIEWYRHDFDLNAIIADTIALIAACLDSPEIMDSIEVLNYREAFQSGADIDVFTTDAESLADRIDADADLRRSVGDDCDAWLDLILSSEIVPGFANDRPTVLRHYPARQAALARYCPNDQRVADRFEVFFGSMEIANGYVELSDADEQRDRFETDQRKRRRRGQSVHPSDPHLLDALRAGLPACAGVAVGLERLHMIHDQTEDISDVVSFSSKENL